MRELEKHQTCGEELQRAVLQYLIARGKDTEYGREHGFATTKSYDDFVKMNPVNSYEELKGQIDRMRHGEQDVLWPGRVKWYAKSSGTTNDKSKFIPVSSEGLQRIHYAGGRDSVTLYLRNNPQSRMFDGKGLILGGSHAPNYNVKDSLVGDLSAILIENINPLVNFVRVPKKETALLSDFEVKRERIAREAMTKNVTNISGVPSWMLSVLNCMMEMTGKTHLEEVWPNLEVFFHGGVAFTPYRKQYEQLITTPNMHYMETYNASEGFFGIQDDPADKSMLLMLDYGVFYEFMETPSKPPQGEALGHSPSGEPERGPVIALLAGSRKQEIKDNLPAMIEATRHLADRYDIVLAGAPSIETAYYEPFLKGSTVRLVSNETYSLLAKATAALVTSGTATLEACMFRVPQVVCYKTPLAKLVGFLKRHVLKVKYVSLVNLIADREVVRELVAETFSADNIRQELEAVLPGGDKRQQMLSDYEDVHQRLGESHAPDEAARIMIELLKCKNVKI